MGDAQKLPKRVLLKLSGEALMGDEAYGIAPQFLKVLVEEIRAVHDLGIQLALVIGGGNIFRGVKGTAHGMGRSRSDQMGMLATVINGLAMQSALKQNGIDAIVQSALEMPRVAEPFDHDQAIMHMDNGRIVIFVAGTGNPYFTTDTAAALRANEISADLLLKATKVDGVYDKDPVAHTDAVRFDRLTYTQVMEKNLKVMDMTAITLCRENGMPIGVFSIFERGALTAVLKGEPKATMIEEA
uniref:Uridylate kinase n=1 Tax=Magnetococcus massalia (strain MO-1) TaxID=451514 RepID=A0A1S7LGY7_MAGMO|nr:Uridylate kinase (UK) (Uridine monophosphate kinase) (UMP kinase) [Candidatus Magnetococcus massalia]